jgi:hypothetical protein
MSKNQGEISKLYRDADMKPPVGKGEHTMVFHHMVTALGKSGIKNPYAVAMAKLGRDKAVHKSHWSKPHRRETR